MLKKDELVKQPGYWLEMLQNEIFRQVADYIEKNNINQTQFAQELGVSRGYVSQVMKGEFNYTLKKLIELSLAIGKAPVLKFLPLNEVVRYGETGSDILPDTSLNKVAEPKRGNQ